MMMRTTAFLTLLMFLIAGCGGTPPSAEEVERQAFDDLREEVQLAIDDEDREAKVLKVVDQLQVDLATLRELAEQRREALLALNADYDATREQFEELLAEFRQQRDEGHARFREARKAFVESTTPEEWDRLEKTSTKAMTKLARQIGSI